MMPPSCSLAAECRTGILAGQPQASGFALPAASVAPAGEPGGAGFRFVSTDAVQGEPVLTTGAKQ
eukprot:scaffold20054_cov125-Isochrysis_galbana.AAC.7